ncbi:hypothetical protein EMGBS4_19430 [Acidimicrobiaceae bacterium]|nr:hypothetical protein EMGBS4_19430 [Acidimicrobiaceae bacterium]
MSEQFSIQVDKILKRLAKKSAVEYLSKIEIVKFDYRKDFDIPEGFTYGDRTHWSTVGEKVFGKRIIDDPQFKNFSNSRFVVLLSPPPTKGLLVRLIAAIA